MALGADSATDVFPGKPCGGLKWLYIITVYVQVFPLRERGQRLTRQVILDRGPVSGEFLYRERIARSGQFLATLVVSTDGTYGLPPLDRAVFRRVTPQGMLVAGKEVLTRVPSIKSNADWWPQSWWCVPYGLQLSPPLAAAMDAPREMPAWQRATGVGD